MIARRRFLRDRPAGGRGETILRFATVGAVTTLLDLGIFSTLIAAGALPAVANVFSYSCGIAVSYLLNRSWTFGVGGSYAQAVRFVLTTLTGLLISTIVVALLSLVLPALHAKMLSILPVFAWNYLAASTWVFNEARRSEKPMRSKGLP